MLQPEAVAGLVDDGVGVVSEVQVEVVMVVEAAYQVGRLAQDRAARRLPAVAVRGESIRVVVIRADRRRSDDLINVLAGRIVPAESRDHVGHARGPGHAAAVRQRLRGRGQLNDRHVQGFERRTRVGHQLGPLVGSVVEPREVRGCVVGVVVAVGVGQLRPLDNRVRDGVVVVVQLGCRDVADSPDRRRQDMVRPGEVVAEVHEDVRRREDAVFERLEPRTNAAGRVLGRVTGLAE